MLIVGINARSRRFAEHLSELGYHVMGFVGEEAAEGDLPEATPRVADLGDLDGYLRHHVVDEVVLALTSNAAYGQGEWVCRVCATQGITLRLLLGSVRPTPAAVTVELLTLWNGAMADGLPMLLKRTFDFLAAALLLVALAPLLVVVAALIKLTSEGPVFFVQDRVGLNKRWFGCYKFRTMVRDAEQRIRELEARNEADGPVFKIARDPRVTALGHFLRKTSIDELPQLYNVLKGDMSLVGPRPLPLRDYEGFSEDSHRRRFSVRPGITCLWQVSGRSNLPFEKWMKLDLEYIDGWSLWLDFRILVLTLPAVLRGTGAA